MSMLDAFSSFELLILFVVIPSTFVFLWLLIFGDFKNFPSSRKILLSYTAPDMVNCYQNYTQKKVD